MVGKKVGTHPLLVRRPGPSCPERDRLSFQKMASESLRLSKGHLGNKREIEMNRINQQFATLSKLPILRIILAIRKRERLENDPRLRIRRCPLAARRPAQRWM
jgi:hypothetical protein